MQSKIKIGIVLTLSALSFAFGRYSVKEKVVTVTKEVIKEKEQDKHRVTVITKKPSGEETTTITEDTKTQTDTKSLDITKEVDQGKKVMTNISALAGIDFNTKKEAYGLSASREFLGPVTIGAYGMTNGIVGISIGVNF